MERTSSEVVEEVSVEALQFDFALHRHADVVFDREPGELFAIDQDEPKVGQFDRTPCVLRESTGGDENAAVGSMLCECAEESVDVRAAHGRIRPALRLQVDAVELDPALDVGGAETLFQLPSPRASKYFRSS